jgi:Tfp pilus assembly protein PilV
MVSQIALEACFKITCRKRQFRDDPAHAMRAAVLCHQNMPNVRKSADLSSPLVFQDLAFKSWLSRAGFQQSAFLTWRWTPLEDLAFGFEHTI